MLMFKAQKTLMHMVWTEGLHGRPASHKPCMPHQVTKILRGGVVWKKDMGALRAARAQGCSVQVCSYDADTQGPLQEQGPNSHEHQHRSMANS